MIVTLIASSVLLLLQASAGSIEGVVVNSATNRPISGAQVSATRISGNPSGPAGVVGGGLRGITVVNAGGVIGAGAAVAPEVGGQLGRPVQIPSATTDASGHFVFLNLEASSYVLRAAADGFATQEFNNRSGDQPGMSAQLSLAAGQTINNVVLRLVPAGTISGRVTGSNGEPLVNIEVSVLRRTYDFNGRKTFQTASSAQTNDRGEYRLFWITPGAYYLSAAPSNRPIPGVPFNLAGRSNRYARVFYPSTTDVATATSVDVQPAVELSGMDFRLGDQQTYRVRGRIVDPSSGQIPRTASVQIVPRNPVVNSGTFSSGSPYNPVDGTFELRDIASGSYRIIAQLPNIRRDPGQPFITPPTGSALVDVAGADVDGVVVTITPPVSIAGRMRIEGGSTSPTLAATVMLRPTSSGPIPAPIRPGQPNAEGVFTIEGVPAGEYDVVVNAPVVGQGTNYVKEIRFGAMDVLTHPLVITGPVSDTLDIVFGTNAGQITGTVRSDSQQFVTNAQVVLVPDERTRHDLFKISATNPSGHFTFQSVTPGPYKVFAWQNLERNSWFDPAVLAGYEQVGTPVTVSGSSNPTLDLKAIPAR